MLNRLVKLILFFLLKADGAGGRISVEGTAQFGEHFLDGLEGFGIWELVADGDHATHLYRSRR